MVQCVKTARKKKYVCIGDLNKLIIIKSRAIQTPSSGSVDYDEAFTSIGSHWAMLETVPGKTFFGDTDTGEQIYTHKFYIRYIASITSENWIEYNSELYKIINVENTGENNSFLFLRALIRGDKTKPANWR